MRPPLYTPLALLGTAALMTLALYATQGTAKPAAMWNWMDIVGEGGTALFAGVWLALILSSRPGGRVTTLLALGLGAITFGALADCLDEFWKIAPQAHWDHWLEGVLTPGGMLTLTVGLYFWRQEQFALNEHLLRRERLFREHRAFDRITQLANADYLRRQITLEQSRAPDAPCALVLLDIDRFHLINREFGRAEGDRVLQAISHLLLLNLRNDDLLCRYAGDRFAVLLPETDGAAAQAIATTLRNAVEQLAWHTRNGARLALSARVVAAVADTSPGSLLDALNHAIEPAARRPGGALQAA